MAKSLEQYSQAVKASIGLPSLLSQLQVEASADLCMYSEKFVEYELKRARFSDIIKYAGDKPLSDSAVENKWLLEEDGEKWLYLKHYMASLKQMGKSIESATFTANQESRNIQ